MGGPIQETDAGPVYGKTPYFFSPKTLTDWVAQYRVIRPIFHFKETGFMKPELTFAENYCV
jgi:hypothetical protein